MDKTPVYCSTASFFHDFMNSIISHSSSFTQSSTLQSSPFNPFSTQFITSINQTYTHTSTPLNRYDTLNLHLSGDTFTLSHMSNYHITQDPENHILKIKPRYNLIREIEGLSSVYISAKYSPTYDIIPIKAHFEISSKILNDDFLTGITLSNIEEVFKSLSPIMCIHDPIYALSQCTCTRADIFTHFSNIKISDIIPIIEKSLSKRFELLTPKPHSITIQARKKNSDSKIGRPRLSIYDKAIERKEQAHSQWERIRDTEAGHICANTTRFEVQLQNEKAISYFLKIKKNADSKIPLIDVLSSTINPLPAYIHEAMPDFPANYLDNKPQQTKHIDRLPSTIAELDKWLKAKGYEHLLDLAGRTEAGIRGWVLTHIEGGKGASTRTNRITKILGDCRELGLM